MVCTVDRKVLTTRCLAISLGTYLSLPTYPSLGTYPGGQLSRGSQSRAVRRAVRGGTQGAARVPQPFFGWTAVVHT